MRRRTFRGAVAVMALTTAALIGTAGSALACYSDDTRPHPTPGKATPCAEGTSLDQKDVVFELTKNNTRLNIKSVNEGVTVTRIVVVGGNDGFNDYAPGKKQLGTNAPWNDLRAPFNYDRSQPKIDHWFLCGKKTTKPTETVTAPPTKPTKPAETTKPSAPATSDTSVAPTSSTTTPAAVPAGNESGTGGGLANTGFDNSWLIWVAGLLLVAGGGLLALLKFRRKASE
ncbi:LPXTG cell wall anchor domain-containing protein [Amycolatopsis sp. NPDC004625]|uniref:LPXTG cell wall anchor domain-containing protein n=1 Tax=Amycolatopsis sp. NPDC004625 TaxID=3154670 RepID=UPI0033B92838